jgi:hypothetical protein
VPASGEPGDPVLDPAGRDQVVDVDRLGLAEAEDPADALLEHRRVPREVEVDAAACGALEVEADATRVGREQDTRVGIVVERDEVLGAPPLHLLAGEERRAQAARASTSAVTHAASRSMRRHWLNTTTLRCWVTTRSVMRSRNSMSLGLSSFASKRSDRSPARSRVGHTSTKSRSAMPLQIMRCSVRTA